MRWRIWYNTDHWLSEFEVAIEHDATDGTEHAQYLVRGHGVMEQEVTS